MAVKTMEGVTSLPSPSSVESLPVVTDLEGMTSLSSRLTGLPGEPLVTVVLSEVVTSMSPWTMGPQLRSPGPGKRRTMMLMWGRRKMK